MEGTISEIRMFGGNFAPRDWAFCQGQLLPIAQYSALFSLLGTIYGGDGRTTFALPDLRGRVPVGAGQGPGLSNIPQGQQGGAEEIQLTVSHLPSHTHAASTEGMSVDGSNFTADLKGSNGEANRPIPGGRTIARHDNAAFNSDDPDASLKDGSVAVSGSAPVSGDVTIGNTGGGQPYSNRQPFLGMYYIICLSGIYPSRP